MTVTPGKDDPMALHVGTSGWQYRDWRGAFYPADLPQSRWLEHYAARFATVEVNNTFYRLPERSTFEEWAKRTPDDFVLAMKASRYLTHIRRLRDPAEPVGRMLDRAQGLAVKLGPVLVQLPPNLPGDATRLKETLARFPRRVRVAFEPRHSSWFTDEVYDVFLRFHEGTARPRPCYGDRALSGWAERLAEHWPTSVDGYVFFNNDPRACAVRNAARFAVLAARTGLHPTRAPKPADIHVRGR
jgi:uncharacterized protein YecE (DUF72 family)